MDIIAGYTTGLKRFYFDSNFIYLFNKENENKYLFIGYYDKIDIRYSSGHYPQLLASLSPLIGEYDYFDYYLNKKISLGLKYGISKVKEFQISVTVGSMNIIRELKNYRWKMDKNGESLNVPIDNYNHALDAMRYVVVNKAFVRKKRMTGVRRIKL